MDEFSFLGSSEIESIDQMYQKYQEDPDSVEESWKQFFKGFEFAIKNYTAAEVNSETFDKEFKVINLIDAYRKRGHLFTKTNPVRTRRKYFPKLDLENYGLSEADLDTEFHAGREIGIGTTSLKNIVDFLRETYCGSIGSEYLFIRKPERIQWLKNKIERSKNSTRFNVEEKKQIYNYLVQSVEFEKFIHKKFTGQKRFSLEGTETLIPALHHIVDKGSELGAEEFIIGMSHRGRLNVMANFLQKPYENIFQEFMADEYEDSIALGDVKYHLGYGNNVATHSGKKVRLNLAPNPSHLEAVGPVIQGIARAKIDHKYNRDEDKLIPVLIHGDAAIAGQGVVYEVIQMSELNGYKTGGTIHLVINNQVGFTTNYLDGRSSTYCTDIGKVTKAPIWHVNGDDVEALVHTVRMAIEYRHEFNTDVFIDILSYRKFGHNEGDEPRFTQPLLYQEIENHPSPLDIYSDKLINDNIYSKKEIETHRNDFEETLENKLTKARKIQKTKIKQFLIEDWKNYKYPEKKDFKNHIPTGVDKKKLLDIVEKINTLPEDKKFFRKTHKLIEYRNKLLKEKNIDWALAELLAYGSLLNEGIPVRISGQDSVRGTFSHRHAAHVVEDSDQTYIPLEHLDKSQAHFHIYNSPLNEYGVMGFEYGYALAKPNGLTVWEAQFGDFMNVAQVIIDQYIASAEEKWGLMNGIVLYLPHGFEGQGPEHSSARIERFLSVTARNNMQIVNCTTPSNFFHVLRQHMHRDFMVPLVVFTPKSLLRHPKCISPLDDLTRGSFTEVYDDENVDVEEVRRVVFCSGKIYYDLLEKKEEFNARDVALVRVEQLHPLPIDQLEKIKSKYKNALLHLWVQEEPENMGAWYYIQNQIPHFKLVGVTRMPSGSPATGLSKIHNIQQKEIIDKVFRKCDCELKNRYCGLQCMIGKSRKEILKQHKYFQQSTVTIVEP